MPLAVFVEKIFAQKLKLFLREKNLLAKGFEPAKSAGTIGFGIERQLNSIERKELLNLVKEFSVKKIRKKKDAIAMDFGKGNLKHLLSKVLAKSELGKIVSSFDSVGNIAVIEIPKDLEKKEKLIGKALLESNKNFETVCKITGAHDGKFRVQPVKVIAGKRNKTALYKESGCRFNVTIDKVFFSPRLSFERLRIAKQIKEGEIVGAFFAGVGPFPIVFAKNSKMSKAYAIELNPFAFRQLKENIELNKMQGRVEAIFGDVKKIVPKKIFGKCDRIAMPLPHSGEHFLEEAFIALKPEGGIIHFYQIVDSKNPYELPLKQVEIVAIKFGKKFKVLNKRQARGFSASKIQVAIDFQVF